MWQYKSDSAYLGEALISQQEVEREKKNKSLCGFLSKNDKKRGKEKKTEKVEKVNLFAVKTRNEQNRKEQTKTKYSQGKKKQIHRDK